MSSNEVQSELTTSQINQSEAGPDTVQVDETLFKNAQSLDYFESLKSAPTGRDFSKDSFYTKFDPLVGLPKESDQAEKNGSGDNEKSKGTTQSPAIQVLDRLISLSPSPKQPVNVVTPLKNEKTDSPVSSKPDKEHSLLKLDSLEQSVLEIELSKLHDLLVKQDKVSQEKMEDYESKLTKLTGQMCVLRDELKQAEDRERALVKKVNEQNQNHVQLSIVMQEYEKLISKLTAEIETEKKRNKEKLDALSVEKDSALGHLNNVEAAFTDVHQKYEKCKKVIEDYKKNEIKMKTIISDQQESLRIKEKQLDTVQTHAAKQLENAHKEVQRSQTTHEQELTRLRALLRKTELKVISLQESLDQKIKENQELTTICDDLIEGKVVTH